MTIQEIMDNAYPELEKILMSDELEKLEQGSPEYQAATREAYRKERRAKGPEDAEA